MTRIGLAALALVLCGSAVWAEPRTYVVDKDATTLVVFLYKAGAASGLAHDHVVQARDVSGRISYDPSDLASTALVVSARAASLTPDPPALLRRFKVDGTTDSDDRAEIAETLKGEEQLHVARYPEIRFESTAFTPTDDGKLDLRGKFTLRGVTREVSLRVTLELDGQVLRGSGSFEIRQSRFGYEPYSAFLGAVRVQDRARVLVELVARPAD